ncbi:helix-turn-helix transcriptional regulator [Brevundimonas sp. TWP2-3-4b1]|uniref:helix-turn-helix transcriptional regulator n=1 Tax=Brevundimonas sp. TWP2-3-4b1 TaxID=2804580 RepID=UPI003CE80ED6
MADLTPEACKAARALLRWSMSDLAEAAGVSLPTIQRTEKDGRSYPSTQVKLIATFRAHGVDVLGPPADGARRIPRA